MKISVILSGDATNLHHGPGVSRIAIKLRLISLGLCDLDHHCRGSTSLFSKINWKTR